MLDLTICWLVVQALFQGDEPLNLEGAVHRHFRLYLPPPYQCSYNVRLFSRSPGHSRGDI